MEREMTKTLAVVISGGAVVFALAAAIGALGANEASAAPAGVASANLLTPSDPPIIRDSSVKAASYGLEPPIVDDAAQAAPSQGNDPPIIDDAAQVASSSGLAPPIVDD